MAEDFLGFYSSQMISPDEIFPILVRSSKAY